MSAMFSYCSFGGAGSRDTPRSKSSQTGNSGSFEISSLGSLGNDKNSGTFSSDSFGANGNNSFRKNQSAGYDYNSNVIQGNLNSNASMQNSYKCSQRQVARRFSPGESIGLGSLDPFNGSQLHSFGGGMHHSYSESMASHAANTGSFQPDFVPRGSDFPSKSSNSWDSMGQSFDSKSVQISSSRNCEVENVKIRHYQPPDTEEHMAERISLNSGLFYNSNRSFNMMPYSSCSESHYGPTQIATGTTPTNAIGDICDITENQLSSIKISMTNNDGRKERNGTSLLSRPFSIISPKSPPATEEDHGGAKMIAETKSGVPCQNTSTCPGLCSDQYLNSGARPKIPSNNMNCISNNSKDQAIGRRLSTGTFTYSTSQQNMEESMHSLLNHMEPAVENPKAPYHTKDRDKSWIYGGDMAYDSNFPTTTLSRGNCFEEESKNLAQNDENQRGASALNKVAKRRSKPLGNDLGQNGENAKNGLETVLAKGDQVQIKSHECMGKIPDNEILDESGNVAPFKNDGSVNESTVAANTSDASGINQDGTIKTTNNGSVGNNSSTVAPVNNTRDGNHGSRAGDGNHDSTVAPSSNTRDGNNGSAVAPVSNTRDGNHGSAVAPAITDCRNFKGKYKKQDWNTTARSANDILCIQDHPLTGKRYFVAYLCVAKADLERFGKAFYTKLTEWEFKIFLPEKDLLASGFHYENICWALEERCQGKIIIVLSKNFERSAECKFITHYALSLDPNLQRRNLIPVVIDDNCNLPRSLSGVTIINYAHNMRRGWLKSRIADAVLTP